jgi:hypothetical protein
MCRLCGFRILQQPSYYEASTADMLQVFLKAYVHFADVKSDLETACERLNDFCTYFAKTSNGLSIEDRVILTAVLGIPLTSTNRPFIPMALAPEVGGSAHLCRSANAATPQHRRRNTAL